MNSLILQTATSILTPMILVLSAYFFLRGHDAPGGGFIAGLIAASVIVLRRFADKRPLGRFNHISGERLVAVGLAIALVTGLTTLSLGGSFLGPAIWRSEVALVGELKVTASLFFDAGVYLVVIGVVRSITTHLGEEQS